MKISDPSIKTAAVPETGVSARMSGKAHNEKRLLQLYVRGDCPFRYLGLTSATVLGYQDFLVLIIVSFMPQFKSWLAFL